MLNMVSKYFSVKTLSFKVILTNNWSCEYIPRAAHSDRVDMGKCPWGGVYIQLTCYRQVKHCSALPPSALPTGCCWEKLCRILGYLELESSLVILQNWLRPHTFRMTERRMCRCSPQFSWKADVSQSPWSLLSPYRKLGEKQKKMPLMNWEALSVFWFWHRMKHQPSQGGGRRLSVAGSLRRTQV